MFIWGHVAIAVVMTVGGMTWKKGLTWRHVWIDDDCRNESDQEKGNDARHREEGS